MNDRIVSILELARESLPSGLIGAEGYARLAAVAERLPGVLTTFWGFECRLGEAQAKADILFETKKESPGQRLLAGQTASPLDAMCARWPAWQSLRTFARIWADPNHQFSAHIRNIWLEFDTAAVSGSAQIDDVLRQPCIFFGPERKTLANGEFFHLIRDALVAFGAANLGGDNLQTFVSTLSDGARLFQVGLMLARPNPGLRVCVYTPDTEKIPAWLSDLNWQGDTEALGELLRQLTPMLRDTMAVGLNLMPEGLAKKIGLECYMDWYEDDPAQWIPLLDFIEEMNLCLPQKRQGILAFPGITRVPGSWQKTSDGVFYINLYRKIHHLKLSIAAGQASEAKIYLAMSRPGFNLETMHAEHSEGAWLV